MLPSHLAVTYSEDPVPSAAEILSIPALWLTVTLIVFTWWTWGSLMPSAALTGVIVGTYLGIGLALGIREARVTAPAYGILAASAGILIIAGSAVGLAVVGVTLLFTLAAGVTTRLLRSWISQLQV